MRDVRSPRLRRHQKSGAFREKGHRVEKQKEASFLTDDAVDTGALKAAVDATGYTCLSVESFPFEEKKGLFFRR